MKTTRKKPRMSFLQRVSFSLGHIMNDLVLAMYTSYLLTYQTKVLGLSSEIVGLLWIIPAGINAFLALLVGYISDNFVVPIVSKFYGRRKTWHLIGCILVGVFFPFLLMPCFMCGESYPEWTVAAYYITVAVFANTGWCFTQANHLALIPEIAKRPNEMVELGAIGSAVTFASGIYMYVVTWVLLDSDSEASLSYDQWKDFMNLAIIVVCTGAFFVVIFHVGTNEPMPSRRNKKGREQRKKPEIQHSNGLRTFSTNSIEKKVPSDIKGSLYSTHAYDLSEVIQGKRATAIVNSSFEADDGDIQVQIRELSEVMTESYSCDERPLDTELGVVAITTEQMSRSAIGEKDKRRDKFYTYETASISSESSGYEEGELSSKEDNSRWDSFMSSDSTDTEGANIYMPTVYLDGVAHHSSLFLRSRPGSRISKVTPMPSPRLQRAQKQCDNNLCNTRGQLSAPGIEEYFAKELSNVQDRSFDNDTIMSEKSNCDMVIIESRRREVSAKKSWIHLFKDPMYYKVGFAYMCTRAAQNITNSYFPIFLTDYLKFGKEAIAYFPLVTLVSGVFASCATKKLNKTLGNKWTFCLGSLIVMGSSVWFYALTKESRSMTYAPAILSGCGTSIMFVTTLAMAAEFVDADRSSGAFVMASMTLLAKIVLGTLFFLLQQFYPNVKGSDCVECTEYIHHVFSLIPGVAAFMGLIAFFMFIPATVKCKQITHTIDAETQTDGSPFDPPTSFTQGFSCEDETRVTMTSAVEDTPPQIIVNQACEDKIENPETVVYGNHIITSL